MTGISATSEAVQLSHHIALQSLTISDCRSICSIVIELLNNTADVFLELSSCEHIDEAGFQLLVLLKIDARVSDRIHCSAPHPNIVAQAQQLGLKQWLSEVMLLGAA
jgi:anti-anti-sigma regulatory factor